MVVAIIQARTGSSRLPGKVLKILQDKTVIGHIITRLAECKYIDKIVLATSTEKSDDALVTECSDYGISCYRGNLENVLDRMYNAAEIYKATHVIRICGDTPLIDSNHVDNAIDYYLKNDYDIVGIKNGTTGFEIFSLDVLKEAAECATNDYQKEHVTPYIYENGTSSYYVNAIDCSKYRFTLDTQEDWEVVKALYQHLYKKGKYFSLESAKEFLDNNPQIAEINAHVQQITLNKKE